MSVYEKLVTLNNELYQLEHLGALASWDEAVMMPVGGGQARAQAVGYLSQLKHEKLTADAVGQLLDAVESESLTALQERNVKLLKNRYLSEKKLPAKLVADFSQACVLTEQAWRHLRMENDWQSFQPMLEKNVALVREIANIKADVFNVSPYDALLDEFSPEITTSTIEPIFAALKRELPSLVDDILKRQSSNTPLPLEGPFDEYTQYDVCKELMALLGFDFNHGRLDVSHHPFCGGVARDVRITTRFNEQEFLSSVMGTCHETGHAMYELGLNDDWLGQPIGLAYGMSLHESQSLFVEMQVCRSKPFMTVLNSVLEKHFGVRDEFSNDNLHKHILRVEKGLIRVDADEVTYPLHVILRFECEKRLLSGELSVAELPSFWDELMANYLGLDTKGNFKDGLMQDVHWSCGLFGYFPAYTLGALIAAQLHEAYAKFNPKAPNQISQGEFEPMFAWLRDNVHRVGSSKSFDELMQDATGSKLSVEPYLNHIKERYLHG